MAKRQVEVFTADCPLCEPAVTMVNELACPDCEVTVYDLRESGADRAAGYGIHRVPAVVVEGRLCACCETGAANRADLEAAGIGRPLP
ncbi:MAG: thioredoxin family protein [Actinomycetota bacterium]